MLTAPLAGDLGTEFGIGLYAEREDHIGTIVAAMSSSSFNFAFGTTRGNAEKIDEPPNQGALALFPSFRVQYSINKS